MKRDVLIWKESIYKNHFVCKCGEKLADKDTGEPVADLPCLQSPTQLVGICPKCQEAVFVMVCEDLPKELKGGLHGDIHSLDFLKDTLGNGMN